MSGSLEPTARRRWPSGGVVAICGLLAALLFGGLAGETPNALPTHESSALYVGSVACSRCHSAIYRSYMKTAMGRSMASATTGPLPDLSLPAHFTNDKLDRRFDVFTRDGKLYESEYAIASDSSEIFRDTRPMEWLIGAGINMYVGVKSAGYAVSEEAPVFLLVFALPALVALAVWWKLRH